MENYFLRKRFRDKIWNTGEYYHNDYQNQFTVAISTSSLIIAFNTTTIRTRDTVERFTLRVNLYFSGFKYNTICSYTVKIVYWFGWVVNRYVDVIFYPLCLLFCEFQIFGSFFQFFLYWLPRLNKKIYIYLRFTMDGIMHVRLYTWDEYIK